MTTWNVKELLLSQLTDRIKWKDIKFDNSILSKIVWHHCLPFVDKQRSVKCLLFHFLPHPSPRLLPLPPPNFIARPHGYDALSPLTKRNRKGLLRRLTFLHLLICWSACVDLSSGKVKKMTCTLEPVSENGKCTYSNRKSSCYLREYAAHFPPTGREPGLVIQQVILRFAQDLVCIHTLRITLKCFTYSLTAGRDLIRLSSICAYLLVLIFTLLIKV